MFKANWIAAALVAALAACGGGGGGSGDGRLEDPPLPPPSPNHAPVGSAGSAQQVLAGTTVTLDASASTDADNDALGFAWSWTSKPAGSAATLSSAGAVKPTFVADVPGRYELSLVVSDARSSSPAASVTVTASAANAAPVANAGAALNAVAGTTVTLDGSASSDANGDALSYAWTLTGKPAGSAATLSGAATARPSFVADLPGSYVASLVVSDGQAASAAATVTVTVAAGNVAPVANAGAARTLTALQSVTLDGSASSDANGDALGYTWTLTSKPAGSAATLAPADAARPSFFADQPGDYVAKLVVSDGRLASAPATVAVTAQPPLVAPETWVVLGSSTAAGTGASAGHGWVSLLGQAYAGAGAALANLAVGGKTTYAALPAAAAPTPNRPAPEPALNVDAALAKTPSLLLVSFPTNDTAAGYAVDETVRNLLAIRQAALARGVPVVVLSTQPRNLSAAQLDALEQIDLRLADAVGPCFVPVRMLLSGTDRRLLPLYDAGDGIHPNNAGHAVIEREVKTLLDAGSCVRVAGR